MWASHHVASSPDDPADAAAAALAAGGGKPDAAGDSEAPKVADRPIAEENAIDDAIADMKNPVAKVGPSSFQMQNSAFEFKIHWVLHHFSDCF